MHSQSGHRGHSQWPNKSSAEKRKDQRWERSGAHGRRYKRSRNWRIGSQLEQD